MKRKDQPSTKPTLDKIVRFRCTDPLIADFDAHAERAKTTRSAVLREVMQAWIAKQQRTSA